MKTIVSQYLKTSLILVTASCFLSCSNDSPKLTTPSGSIQKKASDRTSVIDSSPVQVDVLLVIANDSSMAEHDANLAANAAQFTSQLFTNKLVDFHIGVISGMATDQNIGGAWGGRFSGFPKYIDPSTQNPVATLQKNMDVGAHADDPVALFTVVEQALTSPVIDNENAGFLRPGADLVVMLISDTDPEDHGPNAAEFYKFLVALKNGDPQRVSVYAAYAPGQSTCVGEGDPIEIEALLKLAQPNSYGFSLCDPNFGNQLANVSNRIASSVKKSFDLSQLPVVETINVTYGGQAIPNDADTGWTYDSARNRIVLGAHLVLPAAAPGSKIEITYSIGE